MGVNALYTLEFMELWLFGIISPGHFLSICCQYSLVGLNTMDAFMVVIHLRMVMKSIAQGQCDQCARSCLTTWVTFDRFW